jgi:hypothetical protein
VQVDTTLDAPLAAPQPQQVLAVDALCEPFHALAVTDELEATALSH